MGMFANRQFTGGLVMFFFQYLVQAGLFFTIPLYLSVALGLSAIDTGLRIMPLSITLLLAAAGIPRFLPAVSPRRVVRVGLLAMLAGILLLLVAMDVDAGAEIVTVPLLLAGLGIGALASQLGSVTVSAVPDDQSTEVGGLQNTATNLGASLGTALAGSVLIALLTSSFLAGIEQNPAVPSQVSAQADVELASGIPFVSDADLEAAMREAGASEAITSAVVDENGEARLDGLRAALAIMALMALLALFFTGRVPEEQPGTQRDDRPEAVSAGAT
jgi:Na+/melibiose symporter-like transporter